VNEESAAPARCSSTESPATRALMLAAEAEGWRLPPWRLMKGEELGPVQQAFLEQDAFQCGYCTPGQIMAVEGFLRANPIRPG